MNTTSRAYAVVAYLLSIPGALIVLLAGRRDPFGVFHARQSLALGIAMVGAPLLWAVVAWLFAWVPVVGGLIGLVLCALVIAAEVAFVWSWITGIVYALQGRAKLVPLVGRWTVRRLPPPPPEPAMAMEPRVADAG